MVLHSNPKFLCLQTSPLTPSEVATQIFIISVYIIFISILTVYIMHVHLNVSPRSSNSVLGLPQHDIFFLSYIFLLFFTGLFLS